MKLTFGRYIGYNIEEVAAEDPGYIFWMYEKGVMDVLEHIMELASESMRLDVPPPDFEMVHGMMGDKD